MNGFGANYLVANIFLVSFTCHIPIVPLHLCSQSIYFFFVTASTSSCLNMFLFRFFDGFYVGAYRIYFSIVWSWISSDCEPVFIFLSYCTATSCLCVCIWVFCLCCFQQTLTPIALGTFVRKFQQHNLTFSGKKTEKMVSVTWLIQNKLCRNIHCIYFAMATAKHEESFSMSERFSTTEDNKARSKLDDLWLNPDLTNWLTKSLNT